MVEAVRNRRKPERERGKGRRRERREGGFS